ncbi:MAG: hypothetical protein GDA43_00570 [Hormoscilla sp. SP5CHS1]|nr:hypothetical protein [Hormoscilla sp. SP5CHS1]
MNQSTVKERLYNFLPAIYRRQDFLLGEPLRALLAIVEGELGILEADIYNLYENWFIETCDLWVMPYIAELVGIWDLNDPEKIFPIQRSRIGNTMRYRRHKGTPRTLELVIEDTTGWTARVVEMFEYVITTQYLQRPRTHRPATFTLTQSTEMVAMRDYFDSNAHTLDIRAFDVNRVRYNLKSLSLFIWRLESYPVKRSTPCYRREMNIRTVRTTDWQSSPYQFENAVFGFKTAPSQRKLTLPVSPRPMVSKRACYYLSVAKKNCYHCKPAELSANLTGCYTFHPLGYDMPLFNRPQTRENLWEHNLNSSEIPMAIGQEAFQEDIRPYQIEPEPDKEWDKLFIKIFNLRDEWYDLEDDVDYPTKNNSFRLGWTETECRKSFSLEEVPPPEPEPEPEIPLNSPYYYGPDRSLVIYIRVCNLKAEKRQRRKKWQKVREFLPMPPAKIEAKSLRDWQAPSPGKIAVDVELGRLMFAPGEDPGWDNLQVNFSYGFSGNMGGGPYNRGETLANYTDNIWLVARNVPDEEKDNPWWYTNLSEAIAAWQESGEAHGIIRIMDNYAYFNSRNQRGMPIVPEPLVIKMKGCDRLTIEAGNGYNPSISPLGGDLIAIGDQQEEATLRLNGLLCGGKIVTAGNVNLEVDHCTIRPKRDADQKQDSIVGVAEKSYNMKVGIANSMVGNLELPAASQELVVLDSIVDGGRGYAIASKEQSYGPQTKIERTTVFGGVYSKKMLLGSETIFTKPVMVQEREGGGLRYSYAPVKMQKEEGDDSYSYAPVNSQTPERYECQPESSGKPELEPSFTSLEYGQPGYTQLSLTCPDEIENGAGNGAEMGVFNNLKRPQREANLEASLEEYVRYGLEVNKVYKN